MSKRSKGYNDQSNFDDSYEIPPLETKWFIFYTEKASTHKNAGIRRREKKRYYFCEDWTFTEDLYKAKKYDRNEPLMINTFKKLKATWPYRNWCCESRLKEI